MVSKCRLAERDQLTGFTPSLFVVVETYEETGMGITNKLVNFQGNEIATENFNSEFALAHSQSFKSTNIGGFSHCDGMAYVKNGNGEHSSVPLG